MRSGTATALGTASTKDLTRGLLILTAHLRQRVAEANGDIANCRSLKRHDVLSFSCFALRSTHENIWLYWSRLCRCRWLRHSSF
jgi:hypothetical protein